MRWSLLALAMLGVVGCRRDPAPLGQSPRPRDPRDQVIARVGETPIFGSAVADQARRSGKGPRAALDDLVRFELLAQAVARAPTAADPSADPTIDEARRQALVQALLERDLEPALTPASIPDSELRAMYERVKDAYVHPRLVEVAILAVYTGARMKAEPRALAEATARDMEKEARARGLRTAEGFEALGRDPAWVARRVRVSRTWQALDKPFPAAVGAEVAKLSRPGDVTALIADETGYYLACYIGEAPPKNVTFEQARDEIRGRMYERWRADRFLTFTRALIDAHDVEVNANALSSAP